MPGTVLGSGDVMADKDVTVFALRALLVVGEWGDRGGHPWQGAWHKQGCGGGMDGSAGVGMGDTISCPKPWENP